MSNLHPIRPLGNSGLKVPALWLGTMMFGNQTDATEAARIVDSAREHGLFAIDTADNCAVGASERLVGELIVREREQWVLACRPASWRLPAEDEALVDGLVAPGHASTHGYTDPIYPVTGRQPRG